MGKWRKCPTPPSITSIARKSKRWGLISSGEATTGATGTADESGGLYHRLTTSALEATGHPRSPGSVGGASEGDPLGVSFEL